MGRPTRSTAEGRQLEGRPVSREGERKGILLLPTESSLDRYPGREEEVVLP